MPDKINGPRECACAYDSPNDICALHSPQLTASQAEVERLRAALGWYADRSNYGFRVDPDGRLYPQKVILDNGDRARSAIDQYPTPAEDAPTNKGEMG